MVGIIREAISTQDRDGLALLLSAACEVDAVTIHSQEASSTQDRIRGIVPNANQESPDIECEDGRA
jgi:hypothetical protein